MFTTSALLRRTVYNGKENAGPQSGLNTQFALNHGDNWYNETNRARYTWDDTLGFLVPVNKPIVSASAPRYIADHFNWPTLDSAYKVAKGNDAEAANFAISNGLLVGTTGNAGTGIAADGIAISGPTLGYTNGTTLPIEFLTRIKFDAVTALRFFIGFTDTLPTTTLEQPASLSVVTYTTTATDACGILFDTAATTDTMRAVGVAADVDAVHVNTGLVPVADTYNKFYIRVDAGTMRVWVDDVLAATLAAAVTTSVALCPIIVVVPTTTTSVVATSSYLFAK